MTPPTLPIGPLLERLRLAGLADTAIAHHLQINRRQLYRWQQRGLLAGEADRLAVAAGWHPMEVWGEAWLELPIVACAGCGEPAPLSARMAFRSDVERAYCSPACNASRSWRYRPSRSRRAAAA